MNLVDAYVTKVTRTPYEKYGKWWVDVEYNAYGQPGVTEVMFRTKEEAAAVVVGYKFLV